MNNKRKNNVFLLIFAFTGNEIAKKFKISKFEKWTSNKLKEWSGIMELNSPNQEYTLLCMLDLQEDDRDSQESVTLRSNTESNRWHILRKHMLDFPKIEWRSNEIFVIDGIEYSTKKYK